MGYWDPTPGTHAEIQLDLSEGMGGEVHILEEKFDEKCMWAIPIPFKAITMGCTNMNLNEAKTKLIAFTTCASKKLFNL